MPTGPTWGTQSSTSAWRQLRRALIVPAVLFLSGPTPPLRPPGPGARRLTGGWAFLLALAIGSMLRTG